jgi:hypothetical protein
VSLAHGVSVASTRLGQLTASAASLQPNSHLFLDLVRQQ